MKDKKEGITDSRFLIRPLWAWAAMMMLSLISAPVAAQQGNPEVYVDMSVLQGLSGGQPSVQKPLVLRPPAPAPFPSQQPRLIEPDAAANQPSSQPSVQLRASPVATVSKPPSVPNDPVRPSVAQQSPVKTAPSPPEVPIQRLPKKDISPEIVAAPTSVAFPVTTKIRQETSDPAITANTSRPVPVRSGIAGNLKDVVPSRPAPDFDPAASVGTSQPVRDLTEKPHEAEKNVVTSSSVSVAPPVLPGRKPIRQASKGMVDPSSPPPVMETASVEGGVAGAGPEKKPPVPPRRPDVEKVSPEIIAALIERENKKMANEQRAIDLAVPPPPPGPRGAKNMPAVAKPAVEAEPLQEQVVKLPAHSDPLLGNLVEKDKDDLVATIESLVAAREDGRPLPKTANNAVREQGSNIITSEPMQRPYNVYRPKQDISGAEGELLAKPVSPGAIPQEPAQGDPNRLSLPFDLGVTALDGVATGEIEAHLIPLLNNNPGWKLQIQAFASPDKDGVGSARKASLARGMAVRSYLMNKGIEASRMEVRALGAASERLPKDRVDLIVIDPTEKG